MPGNNDTVSGRVKATITLSISWVAEKNACYRTWRELVRGCGVEVWVAKASKHAQMIICGIVTVEELVWCVVVPRTAGTMIESVGGYGQGFRPVRSGNISVEHESADAIV
jgi:hypothetical protein